MTVLVLLLFHKRKLIYGTTFYRRDSTPSYLYKHSRKVPFINSIGGARKGFPNIWKFFLTNVSPWRQKELWRITQKLYRQYIHNNKWEHWSPNNHTKPLKLYVYISIAFLENTVTSLLLQLSVPHYICPIFTFSVILKIMLTACLRVVGTVRGFGISGNKSLK